MNRLLGISVLVLFTIISSLSCYDNSKNTSPLLALGSGAASDTGTAGGDTGGAVVPGPDMCTDDVKEIIDTTLETISFHNLFQGFLKNGTFPFAHITGLTVDAHIATNPFRLSLTITLDQFKMPGRDCAMSGVLLVTSQFSHETTATYMMTINTKSDAPITLQGADCKASTIVITNLEKIIDFEAHKSIYSGTIKIDDKVYELKDFATPEEVLAIITGAISKIPWADLHDLLSQGKSSVSGGSSSSSGPLASVTTGYTVTFYEEAGLKVDVGIPDDWSGLILNVYLTNFKPTSSLPIGVSGSLNIFTTFTDWNEVKLVMNTLPNAKLSISGIPLIKPTVALTDVTIYFDWFNLAIVDKAGYMGKMNIMGININFDPSWIATIMDLLKGIVPSLS
jgi:hypothetical protein